MKKLILVLAIGLMAIASCKDPKEMITPSTSANKFNHKETTGAKYPGVTTDLYARFWDGPALTHPNCVTYEMDRKIYSYLEGLGERTPNQFDVGIEFEHSDDICRITYLGVTHSFYTNGTTSWNEETFPGDPAMKKIDEAEQVNGNPLSK